MKIKTKGAIKEMKMTSQKVEYTYLTTPLSKTGEIRHDLTQFIYTTLYTRLITIKGRSLGFENYPTYMQNLFVET